MSAMINAQDRPVVAQPAQHTSSDRTPRLDFLPISTFRTSSACSSGRQRARQTIKVMWLTIADIGRLALAG